MIVDSSAIVAIALNQPEAARVAPVLIADPAPRIFAGNLLEAYLVIDGRWGKQAQAVIERVVLPVGLTIDPVTEAQVELARDAYRRYGKGSGHRARLNYGDCFAYALARFRDEPLLFAGNDFGQTDIVPAL